MKVIKKMKKNRICNPLFKTPDEYYESVGIKIETFSECFGVSGDDKLDKCGVISFLPNYDDEDNPYLYHLLKCC